jgi:hypothetical protein
MLRRHEKQRRNNRDSGEAELLALQGLLSIVNDLCAQLQEALEKSGMTAKFIRRDNEPIDEVREARQEL